MEIKITDIHASKDKGDTRVLGFYQDPVEPEYGYGDPETENIVKVLIQTGDFKGTIGEVFSLTVFRKGFLEKVVLVGLGKKELIDFSTIRRTVNCAVKEAVRIKAKTLEMSPLGARTGLREGDVIRLITEISLLSVYSFDTYKTEKKDVALKKIHILSREPNSQEAVEGYYEGMVLGTATVQARDLVNEPANVLDPIELARRVVELGKQSGFDVEVMHQEQIEKLGMKAFLEVARASDIPPRLIVMRYNGTGISGGDITALVGKGLTYDTGGLSIKTNEGMDTMKRDMGGAASVIGAISAVARLKLKVHVVGVIAACENMVSGRSYRPGDIIGSMAGKSIHVGNTDAEGRLTLIDSIHYALEIEKADRIIDLATLTGDATRTMGHTADVVLSNDDELVAELEKASEFSGERVFRMPIYDEHRELVLSDQADLTNAPVKAKTIAAGAFIREFVQGKPWLHIDIAPTAWANENTGYRSKGGTGTEVRNIYYLLKSLYGSTVKVPAGADTERQEDKGV